jgi:hypothetical protein
MTIIEQLENEVFTEIKLSTTGVQTLTWHGDVLVDWAGGHSQYSMDGSSKRGGYTSYGRRFDCAIAAADGRHVVVYERLGTKALLLRDGRLGRELNRSFYHAGAYEYPITFVTLPNGDTGLVHCPEEYNRLEIDDALTGERLTVGDRKPSDFFHSRLAGNPSGTKFLSAGWVWHPWDAVEFFSVEEALRNPCTLDRGQSLPNAPHVGAVPESSAAWLDDDLVVVAGADEADDNEDTDQRPPRLQPFGLAKFKQTTGECLSAVVLPEVGGTIMPVGLDHVVSFYREPKLVRIDTGAVLHRWTGLASGVQDSSICHHLTVPIPPIALDSKGSRFAVASANMITVVQFKTDLLRERA